MNAQLRVRSTSRGSAFPIFGLAWRNLWRHRVRTLLLVVVVGYVTLITVFYFGYIDGFFISTQAAYARNIVAPVRVARQAWFEDPDPENALESLAFEGELHTLSGVGAVAPRLEFPALLRSAYVSEGVQARGVNPQAEPRLSALPGKLSEGRWLEGLGEVVLGLKLARRVDARIGERVVLDTSALAGPQARGLRVVGIVHARIANVDEGLVLVPLEDARALTGVKTATTLDLDVPLGQVSAVAARVQQGLPPGVQARGVWELMGVVKADMDYHRVSGLTLGLMLALLAALAVASTVLVSVIERTREFGMISALGLEPRALARMVMLESLIATALGGVIGLGLGYALIAYLATHNVIGASFSQIGSGFEEFAIAEEIYANVSPTYIGVAALIVVFVGLLAALVPVRRVLRLRPTDAMRAG
jgi:ABC-type lipoprotein release transport system permease subunit